MIYVGQLFRTVKRRKYVFLWAVIILVPAILSLREIILGTFSFWFDPARDLLLALKNLQKPTLIGVPTGIPGLFYGPYWLWFLSLALLISKDVRWVYFLVSFVPYFIFFPILLRRFDHVWGKLTSMAIWLLFITNYRSYSSSLWNPHLAPILFLLLAYLVAIQRSKSKLHYFVIGAATGLIVSFHFSFGIACFIATVAYLSLEGIYLIKKQKQIFAPFTSLVSFGLGIFGASLPFLVFELRHNFMQIKALVSTITNALFFHTPAVGLTGLSKTDILNEALERLTNLLQVPLPIFIAFGVISLLTLIWYRSKSPDRTRAFNKLVFYSLMVLGAVLGVFLTSKNPVWEYHFIALEVVFLLLIGLLMSKSKTLGVLALVWGLVILGTRVNYVISTLNFDLGSMSSYNTKLLITKKILEDAPDKFSVFTYSSAIYTYDFDYLFLWQTPYFQKVQAADADTVYLIIPKTDPDILTDFIHYKTPDNAFSTQKTWEIADGTTIIKRFKK